MEDTVSKAQLTPLFDNRVLSRIERQRLHPVRRLTNRLQGEHLHGRGGSSNEFSDFRDYACRIVLATHPDTEFSPESVRKYVRWGASPRASQGLLRAARVRALAEGRAHVGFDDIRHFCDEVLQHRVLLNYDGQAENIKVADLVREIVAHVPEQAE